MIFHLHRWVSGLFSYQTIVQFNKLRVKNENKSRICKISSKPRLNTSNICEKPFTNNHRKTSVYLIKFVKIFCFFSFFRLLSLPFLYRHRNRLLVFLCSVHRNSPRPFFNNIRSYTCNTHKQLSLFL